MASSQATYAAAREQVLDHYGRICACCGTWRCLTIDHSRGNGNAHRAELRNPSPREFYRWLVRNNFPAGFRTLCVPCNSSKKQTEFCKLHRKLLIAEVRTNDNS